MTREIGFVEVKLEGFLITMIRELVRIIVEPVDDNVIAFTTAATCVIVWAFIIFLGARILQLKVHINILFFKMWFTICVRNFLDHL